VVSKIIFARADANAPLLAAFPYEEGSLIFSPLFDECYFAGPRRLG